jgi:hypothetical protein
VQRDRLLVFVLALLAVLAFGATAATLDSATGSGAGGDADGVGVGSGDDGFSMGGLPTNETVPESGIDLPPVLLQAVTALLIAVAVLGFALMLYDEGVTVLARLAVVVVLAGLLVALIYFLVQAAGGAGGGGLFGSGEFNLPGGGSGGSGDLSARVVTNPPVALAAVLGVAVLVAAAVLVRATDDSEAGPGREPAEEEPPSPDAAAVGRAAGRAADRIENDGTVDNAVFRAWREMTDDLDVPRGTTTPGEFAEAAVAAGMEPADVRELTGLFEDVRYGGQAADAERERRAVDALRRIEDAYGDRR